MRNVDDKATNVVRRVELGEHPERELSAHADGQCGLAFEEAGESHGTQAAPAGELGGGVEVVAGVGKCPARLVPRVVEALRGCVEHKPTWAAGGLTSHDYGVTMDVNG